MQITQSNRLVIPNICIFLIRLILFFRFCICPKSILFLFSLYWECKFRTSCAMARKRLVYASKRREMAENNSAGVVRVNFMRYNKYPDRYFKCFEIVSRSTLYLIGFARKSSQPTEKQLFLSSSIAKAV